LKKHPEFSPETPRKRHQIRMGRKSGYSSNSNSRTSRKYSGNSEKWYEDDLYSRYRLWWSGWDCPGSQKIYERRM